MKNKKTILVVEDDKETAKWIGFEFFKLGFRVLHSDHPEKAWALIDSSNQYQRQGRAEGEAPVAGLLEGATQAPVIDIVYIDVNYGSKPLGFSLAHQIKDNPKLALRYFIMSMDDCNAYHEQAEEVGALGFVEKKKEFLLGSLSLAMEALYNAGFEEDWGNWKQNKFSFARRIYSTSTERRFMEEFLKYGES